MSRGWAEGLRGAAVALALGACGGAQPPPDPPPTSAPPPVAQERACFRGTTENGVCEVFSAAREPLPPLASSCRAAGGQWLEACPEVGRVGSCTGQEGAHAIYYGVGIGSEALQQACEAEGHTFAP